MDIDTSRPVAFLDIDGVLNGGWQHEFYSSINGKDIAHRDGRGDWVCRSKMNTLFGIFRIHRVQVIIVSSWCRSYQYPGSPCIDGLRTFFEYDDILCSLATGGGIERPNSILEFLSEYPDITNWVAIDDSHHLYREVDFYLDRLIACNGRYGLADCQMAEVDDLLRTNKRRVSPYKNTL